MPLAGRMKLRTFLMIGVGAIVLLLGGTGGAFALWGVPAIADMQVNAELEKEEKARLMQEEAQRQEALVREERARRQQALELAQAQRAAAGELTPEAVAQRVAGLTEPVDLPGGRAVDEAVVRYLGKPLGTDKRKDVTSGRPYKINVYQDAGQPVANRAKVDLDRDDKWDEKWTWEAGVISRKTAPGDDESYTVEEVWQAGGWVAR